MYDVSQLGLVEARVTHVRANNEPEASLAHAKIYFLVYLWQGVAVGLNVECSKLKNDVKGMHKQFTIRNASLNTKINYTTMSSELIKGSRGVIRPNEV